MSRLCNSTLTDVTVRRNSNPNDRSIIERPVLFRVAASSTSCQGCGAANLELPGKARYWGTTTTGGCGEGPDVARDGSARHGGRCGGTAGLGAGEDAWVLLELNQKALLSALVIHNRSVTNVDIEVALENKRHAFVLLKEALPLPHNRKTAVRMGQLPCRYIRLRCRSRGNALVALNGVDVQGLPTHDIKAAIGQSFKRLLGTRPERLVFGPSLEASLPHKDFDARRGGYGGADGRVAGERSAARAARRQERYAELALRAEGRGGLEDCN